MKVLIVEDSDDKRAHLVSFLSEMRPGYAVVTAKSFNSGLNAIMDEEPDLVLLDMSMPTYDLSPEEDGGTHEPYAGREIFRHLDARDLAVRCIVVTQFDRFGEGKDAMTVRQLEAMLREEHPRHFIGRVSFDSRTASWKDALLEHLESVEVAND